MILGRPEHVDNFQLRIEAEGEDTLLKVFEVVFSHKAPGHKTTHWSEEKGSLILYWSDPGIALAQKFPVGFSAKSASEVALEWLNAAERPPEPSSFDGSTGSGFLIQSGHVGSSAWSFYEILRVSFRWALYGK